MDFIQAESADMLELNKRINGKYPTFVTILTQLASKTGFIEKPISEFLASIITHTENIYKGCAERRNDDYNLRENGEIDSQQFPNFPILRDRANYEKKCNVEDKKSLKEMCEKKFPNHSSLTPGLMIMTCACPQKVVYGFSMMLSGESPQMIFDIIMTRFPEDYNPNIIYDNSCKTKEYGLNRETKQFMKLQITTDKFHECNHTACAESFKSSTYNSLKKCNTQACEQTNKALRYICSLHEPINVYDFIDPIYSISEL